MIANFFVLSLVFFSSVNCQFEWQIKDKYTEIEAKIMSVDKDNCETKQPFELVLPHDAVTQIPDIKKIDPIFKNRTMLRHLYNVVLNRASFYSFIFAKANDSQEPGLMYYFLSQVADVAGNYYVNGSGIFFDRNGSYPNFYRDFYNKTLPYFAPYAFRDDDFYDPANPNRLATLQTIAAKDLGAIPGPKYTNTEFWKVNQFYKLWLPDDTRDLSKTQYHVTLSYSDKPGVITRTEEFSFFGPPGPAENPGPVKWTQPYFDCKRSNKWVVTVTSPIADYYPRHTEWKHLRKHKYIAVATADIDFDRIDINPCPKMKGNLEANAFAGIARCKNTTVCEPLPRYGFSRGGYHCVCAPRHRLPHWQKGPFLGIHIERATQTQYRQSFDCIEIGHIEIKPNPMMISDSQNHEKMRRVKRFSYSNNSKAFKILKQYEYVLLNSKRCSSLPPDDLEMTSDVAFNAQSHFDMQERVALRTANFLSYFLQEVNPNEVYTYRLTDKLFTQDQIFGEVLSNVMGDSLVHGSGIFFDVNKFISRNESKALFAPYAYKISDSNLNFHVIDKAGMSSSSYMDSKVFRRMKEKWGTGNLKKLTRFTTYIEVRADKPGTQLTKYENYPNYFWSPSARDGHWFGPYFNCEGEVQDWILTYAVPFFGKDSIRRNYEFKGIVTVDVKLADLDIDQCSNLNAFMPPSIFSGTDRCHFDSQFCVFIGGTGFRTGGYKCECSQGFEYPYQSTTYFEGEEMEAEWAKKVVGKPNRYDFYKCRIGAASSKDLNAFFTLLFHFF